MSLQIFPLNGSKIYALLRTPKKHVKKEIIIYVILHLTLLLICKIIFTEGYMQSPIHA